MKDNDGWVGDQISTVCNCPSFMVAADVSDDIHFAIGGGEKLNPFGVVDSAKAYVFYLCRLSFIVQTDATVPRFLDTDDIFLTVAQSGVEEGVLEDVGFVDVL